MSHSSLPFAHPGRVLKDGDIFAFLGRNGELQQDQEGETGGGSERGLYARGTRHLSRWQLLLEGRWPNLLNSSLSLDNSVLTVDQALPELPGEGTSPVPRETVHVRRELAVEGDSLHEQLHVRSFHHAPLDLRLEYRFAADFRDIFEVRGAVRKRRGQLREPTRDEEGRWVLAYRGLDGVERRTRIRFAPLPSEAHMDRACFHLRLAPREVYHLEIQVAASSGGESFFVRDHARALAGLERARQRDRDARTEISSDNEQFNDWLNRSATDLQTLITETQYGPYPYAGVPWFSTPFGRDGLLTALQTLWIRPTLAAGVLSFLAATQAREEDARTEAQPGRILHEMREGEMPALGEVPFRRYYGAVDSTPLFVLLAGRYYQRTGDLALIERLWPALILAVRWMEEYGDADGDGFLEYGPHARGGLVQQGWKDSDDSVFHADGIPAEPPIALCEVQAYACEAYASAGRLATLFGHTAEAARWGETARRLQTGLDRQFWLPGPAFYALALDGRKRPCAVRSSNPGHLLFCGAVPPARARLVAEALLGPESFNGWGLRTLFADELRYNPMSYHNGSVWPHDTAVAAAGLARYGFREEALRLLTGLFNASILVDLHRLPELFCGFDRVRGKSPTLYPDACAPQAWAAGSAFLLLGACLGIHFSPESPEIRFDHPRLPDYINELHIEDLRFGESRLDLVLRRYGEDVALHVQKRSGPVRVSVVQ